MISNEIHPTHDPEPVNQRAYRNATACRTCGWFIAFDEGHLKVPAGGRITKRGTEPCPGRCNLALRN